MNTDDEELRLSNKKQIDNKNRKLWQDLKIDFRLEAVQFPDNKIYGIINIIPESSRQLIKKLILVVNKTNRIEFDPDYKTVSAAGFNTNRKNPSAYIEAIPSNIKWLNEPKISDTCYFYFTGEVFALSPTISFDWSNSDEDSNPKLVIKWYHIGDKNAHRYILYLDDIEIQHIRQKIIDDAFDVSICGFQPGKKHTFQLAARVNNGKETYRSDLMEFTVPKRKPTDNDTTEFITVSNEAAPFNLPVVIAINDDKKEEEEESNQNKNQLLEQKNNTKIYTCCNHMPHDRFPGIEHYFQNVINDFLQQQSFNNKKRNISSEETDDDNDVILSNNQ